MLRLLRAAGPAGLNQRTIADRTSIPASRLVGLIDDLEERGWLVRGADAADRRAHAVRLTERGRAAAGELDHAARAYEEELVAGLTAAEHEQLRTLLGRIAPTGGRPAVW